MKAIPPKDPPPPRKRPHPPLTPYSLAVLAEPVYKKSQPLPQSFLDYSQRYRIKYSKIPILKTKYEERLNQVLVNARSYGTLWSNNWSLEPDPMLPTPNKIRKRFVANLAEDDEEENKRKERSERFNREKKQVKRKKRRFNTVIIEEDPDGEAKPVVGSCMSLEKKYLRLKKAPLPHEVRPLKVLVQSLGHIRKKLRKEKSSYLWVCDQLKSIRQDLTVQHLTNDFSVKVYEVHARLSLKHTDLKEFNQCQSNLSELYNSGFGNDENKQEFTAYKILYQIYTRFKYNQQTSETSECIKGLRVKERNSFCLKHAIKTYVAVVQGDFQSVFFLQKTVPGEGKYLFKLFINYVRYAAATIVLRSFRPRLEHETFLQLVDCENKENEQVKQLLEQFPLVIEDNLVDTSKSYQAMNESFEWEVLDGDNVQRSGI